MHVALQCLLACVILSSTSLIAFYLHWGISIAASIALFSFALSNPVVEETPWTVSNPKGTFTDQVRTHAKREQLLLLERLYRLNYLCFLIIFSFCADMSLKCRSAAHSNLFNEFSDSTIGAATVNPTLIPDNVVCCHCLSLHLDEARCSGADVLPHFGRVRGDHVPGLVAWRRDCILRTLGTLQIG